MKQRPQMPWRRDPKLPTIAQLLMLARPNEPYTKRKKRKPNHAHQPQHRREL